MVGSPIDWNFSSATPSPCPRRCDSAARLSQQYVNESRCHQPTIFIGMSGTPVWQPEDCASVDPVRPVESFSEAERGAAAASYKDAAQAAQHLLNMPFLKLQSGLLLSEYYSNAGMLGVV